MRLSTKLGASLSAAALGSAVVLGGAGIAQAQSSGSLGSSDPAPVVLTVSGDTEAVGGEITNNTDGELTCGLAVMDAEVMAELEKLVAGGMSVVEASAELDDKVQESNAEGKNALGSVTVEAGETTDWEGVGSYGPETDPRSGAVAVCGDEVAFAYESGGLFGSLDMGSLGS